SLLQTYPYLKTDPENEETQRSDFNRDTKSKVFIQQALLSPLRCAICKGLIHKNSITIDHIERKEDGGLGRADNGQLTHPYCNSTVKN
ncbi:MAG: HNH endonuclease signature motif containing protein, partial [Candidatus Omnitrophota bacterium]